MACLDVVDAPHWIHHVLVTADDVNLRLKLDAMDAWLSLREIPYRVVALPRDKMAIRLCFLEEEFARAFKACAGGLSVPSDETTLALAATPANDDFYQVLEHQVAD